MSHTKGPWRQSPKAPDAIIVDEFPDDDYYTPERNQSLREYYGGYPVAESIDQRNMPVIIAAPDLFTACEVALRTYDRLDIESACERHAIALLEAAVAKARSTAAPEP